MSPWASDQSSKGVTDSPAEAEHLPEFAGAPLRGPSGLFRFGTRVPFWVRVVPFFLSALLFLSAFLAVISPLPILLLGLSPGRSRRSWAWLAALTNAALVFIFGGGSGVAAFAVFALVPALSMVSLLEKKKKPELTAGISLAAMALSGAAAVFLFSHFAHVHPWAEMKNALSQFVDYWVHTAAFQNQEPADIETWKRGLLVELPSAVAVLALIVVWANLILTLKLNPGDIRSRMGLKSDFFTQWKASEWLLWPTILSGATLLLDLGVVTDLGRNLFKVLMAIYAFQGLSILSFFFSFWRVKKAFHGLGYAAAVLLLMPLLLSLGFFDVWFDFRSKFRQV